MRRGPLTELFELITEDVDGLIPVSLLERIAGPHMDVVELSNGWKYLIDVPGIDPQDIKICVKDKTLEITYEQKESDPTKYVISERRKGSFKRSVILHKTADLGSVVAKNNNGLLEITVLAKEEAKPIEIPISI